MTYADLMTVSRSLATDLADADDHIMKGTQFLGSQSEVVDFGAVARTLSSLLDEIDAPRRIELMSLDVEGAEISVLEGIDHSRYRFRHMLVESRSPDVLDQYLRDSGYELVARLSSHDYLYTDGSWNSAQPSRSSA